MSSEIANRDNGAAGAAADADDMATSQDAFLGGAVTVRQPHQGYRAGLDAVLLAASISAPQSDDRRRLLDVGAGVGTVGLCAAVRLTDLDVTLVEQNPRLCALAAMNISENDMDTRVRVVEQDIVRPHPSAQQQLIDNHYDVVVSNPPFYEVANHRQSPHALKAASHAMPPAGIDSWLRYMARMARAGGTAIMIHRADYLPAMLAAFAPRFGALTVAPLYPRAGEPASRVILRGIKGSRAPLTVAPGRCLHGPGNRFEPSIDKVLKTPAALDLDGGVAHDV